MKQHKDPLIISTNIGPDIIVGKVIIDSGSLVDVL